MKGLAAWQAPDGMWREVIDRPGAYREETATAMILTAMARGVRLGWLDRSYAPTVDRAWRALAAHITEDGGAGGRLHRNRRRPDRPLLPRSAGDRRPRRPRRRDGAGRRDGAADTIRRNRRDRKDRREETYDHPRISRITQIEPGMRMRVARALDCSNVRRRGAAARACETDGVNASRRIIWLAFTPSVPHPDRPLRGRRRTSRYPCNPRNPVIRG